MVNCRHHEMKTFLSYQEIYDLRGDRYHQAMTQWPEARKAEFEALLTAAALPPGPLRILDVPSGGGYLRPYLPDGTTLVCADPAEPFVRSGRAEGIEHVVCARHDRLPFHDGEFDAVLSLAGLHHLANPADIFREWHRVLKPGGRLCIGDARQGSATAAYLDQVVDRYNTQGHRGLYFSPDSVTRLLREAGLTHPVAEEKTYTWDFDSRRDLLDFCRTLFGMDLQPADAALLQGIRETVGFSESPTSCHLHWALLFATATR